MKKVVNLIKKVNEKGARYIISDTIPWLLFNKLEKPISKIVKKIYLGSPLENVIIIESHNDFDSNGGAFYDYLITNGYNMKYKIVWFLRNKCPNNLPRNVEGYRYNRLSIKRLRYHCKAKYIISGHYIIPSIRSGQKTYYTTHGAFGLKWFRGNVKIPKMVDYILTPSELLIPILADQYMLEYPNQRQIILGYPTHDILYSNNFGDLNKLTEGRYLKVILWMPTFRKSVEGRRDSLIDSSLGIPIIESIEMFNDLNNLLETNNILLIIKIHPMQDLRTVKIKSLSNILLLDGNDVKTLKIDNYRLMKDTDALISDYSSSVYDYLHLDRPIAYTMDDVSNYKLGLVVNNPDSLMAGHALYNYRQFKEFIVDIIYERDKYKEKRKELFDKVWKYHDGNSCERLAKHMGIYL